MDVCLCKLSINTMPNWQECIFVGDVRWSYNHCVVTTCTLTMSTTLFVSFLCRIDRSPVQFRVGDACSLLDDIGQFGLVLAANLICRLHRPLDFLNRAKDLVLPSGIMILTTPFTWMEQYTPKVTNKPVCVAHIHIFILRPKIKLEQYTVRSKFLVWKNIGKIILLNWLTGN